MDFEQAFDAGSDSWSVRVATAGSAPARLELWCRGCRTAGEGAGAEPVSGPLASQQLEQQQQQGQQAMAAGGTLVLLLEGAVLPHAAAASIGAASSARRSLQQAAGGCSLLLGGQARTFAACTAAPAGGAYTLKVFSSVEANGAGSLLHVGLASKAGGGWAG